MNNPNLSKWPADLSQLSGLLYFAQRWEEMLFDYSIDSYRFRMLNAPGLCREIIETYRLCEMKMLSWGRLISISEELILILENDLVSQSLLGTRYQALLANFKTWSPQQKNKRDITLAASSIYNTLDNSLQVRLEDELWVAINTPDKKKKIDTLSSALLTEIIRKGVSPQYLYQEVKSFFFESDNINNTEVFKVFVSQITPKVNSYSVVFQAPKTAKLLTKNANPNFVKYSEKFTKLLENDDSEKVFEKGLADRNIFLTFNNILVCDPYTAREMAESRLEMASSFVGHLLHKLEIPPPSDSLVYQDADKKRTFLVRAPTSSTRKRPDIKPWMVDKRLMEMLGPIINEKTEEATRNRLLGALRSHMIGTRAVVPEDQFTNLWTALETLAGNTVEDTVITSILERCTPMLCLKYFRLLLKSLMSDTKRCLGNNLNEILKQKPEDISELRYYYEILVTKERETQLKEILSLCDKNPLLKNRIFRYWKLFQEPGKAHHIISEHEQRVKWHLQRMYRTRNALIHAGQVDRSIKYLVINLHSYVDHIFTEIIKRLKSEIYHSDLDKIYFEYYLTYKVYKDNIKPTEGKDAYNHGLEVLFGPT